MSRVTGVGGNRPDRGRGVAPEPSPEQAFLYVEMLLHRTVVSIVHTGERVHVASSKRRPRHFTPVSNGSVTIYNTCTKTLFGFSAPSIRTPQS